MKPYIQIVTLISSGLSSYSYLIYLDQILTPNEHLTYQQTAVPAFLFMRSKHPSSWLSRIMYLKSETSRLLLVTSISANRRRYTNC